MTQLSIVIERILDSIHKVFTNIFGWIIAVFTAYLFWLGNDSGSFQPVLVALIWDMAWGIAAAVKHHNFVLSYLLRQTFCNIIVYVGAMSIVLLAEMMLGIESGFTVRIITVIATSVELFSSAGNFLILLLVTSCAVCRNGRNAAPDSTHQKDSIIIKEKVIYRDTLILVIVKVTTVQDRTASTDTARTETDLVKAKAWLESDSLRLTITNKPDPIPPVKVTIPEKARTETKTQIRTEVRTIEVNRLTK